MWRAGLASASRWRLSIAPTWDGTVKRPWQRPSPSSVSVSSTPAAARASSFSSASASCDSPTSGATMSRIRLPICFSSRASCRWASSRSVISARSRVRASTWDGSASTASAITRACSVRSSPAVSAEATSGCCSSARPSASSRRVSRRVVRVCTASQAAASRSPCSSPTSSEAARTRAVTASSCERTSVSATSAACLSRVVMNIGSTDATPVSAPRTSVAHSMIGCTGHLLARFTDNAQTWGGSVRHAWHRCQVATREPQGIPSAPRRVLWVTVPIPGSSSPQTMEPFRIGVLRPSYTCSNPTATDFYELNGSASSSRVHRSVRRTT